METQISLTDEAATVAFGRRIAAILATCNDGATIFLDGTLGAGKTTFCRGVLAGLGHSGAVKSPTYTLVEPYQLSARWVYHFDLYRLADPEELEYMGIRDYFDSQAVRLIEWPEKGNGVLPEPDIRLCFKVSGSGRSVMIQAESEAGRAVVTQFI